MIREGIIRSPKWMRSFMDFEINTGNDIKGVPSKSRLEKDRKKKWEEKWLGIEKQKLVSFIQEEILRSSHISNSDIDDVKKRFFGNDDFWVRYEKWEDADKKKKEEQEKLLKEIDDLYNNIIIDFKNYPYRDKILLNSDKSIFSYRFENGDIFKLNISGKYEIHYQGMGYIVSESLYSKFIDLVSQIAKKSTDRPGKWKQKTDTPKDLNKSRYDKLKDLVKIRQDQLDKMDSKDPNKKLLKNELDSYKAKIKQMKDQYKFENLRSFESFSIDELGKLNLSKDEISVRIDEIKDIFHDLELESDISVRFDFQNNNKFLSRIIIELNPKDIDDQVSKIKEIGETISRLSNCMCFCNGKAYGEEYDEVGSFHFDVNFFNDYDADAELELDKGKSIEIGEILKLEIFFMYA